MLGPPDNQACYGECHGYEEFIENFGALPIGGITYDAMRWPHLQEATAVWLLKRETYVDEVGAPRGRLRDRRRNVWLADRHGQWCRGRCCQHRWRLVDVAPYCQLAGMVVAEGPGQAVAQGEQTARSKSEEEKVYHKWLVERMPA